MANRYTEEQELAMREALVMNGGNVKRTSRELGIPYATVHARQKLRGVVSETISASDPDGSLWQRASTLCAERIIVQVPTMPNTPEGLTAVVGAAKVAVNAHLDYRDGRKGSTLNLNTGPTINMHANALIQAILTAPADGA